ncbi:hypothetical protein ACTMU2_38440 [Cupriavidus basilensis]
MAAVVQPPTWNSPTDAATGLAPLLDSAGGVGNVLVMVDPTNVAHRDNDPIYRLARYAASTAGAVWYDARTGLRLYNVAGWQMAQ